MDRPSPPASQPLAGMSSSTWGMINRLVAGDDTGWPVTPTSLRMVLGDHPGLARHLAATVPARDRQMLIAGVCSSAWSGDPAIAAIAVDAARALQPDVTNPQADTAQVHQRVVWTCLLAVHSRSDMAVNAMAASLSDVPHPAFRSPRCAVPGALPCVEAVTMRALCQRYATDAQRVLEDDARWLMVIPRTTSASNERQALVWPGPGSDEARWICHQALKSPGHQAIYGPNPCVDTSVRALFHVTMALRDTSDLPEVPPGGPDGDAVLREALLDLDIATTLASPDDASVVLAAAVAGVMSHRQDTYAAHAARRIMAAAT